MKWFKHHTDSLDDPFVQELIMEFGGNGYMVYFGIIEMVCAQGKNELTGKATFPQQQLANKFALKWKTIDKILTLCSLNIKIKCLYENKKVTIEIPKILEIKDNYTKDLQASRKKASNQKEVDTKDIDKEKEEPKTLVLSENEAWFNLDWLNYPKGGNKKRARASYLKTVKTESDRCDFLRKTKLYIQSVDDPQYLKNGDTWFNQWEGYEVGPKFSSRTKAQKQSDDFDKILQDKFQQAEREKANGTANISEGDQISENLRLDAGGPKF